MPRTVRQARNRELFRSVNDRIANVAAGFAVSSELQIFLCECSRFGCVDQIEVPLVVYERVRGTPNAYLVVEGHEDLAVEAIETRFDDRPCLLVISER